MIIIKKSTIRLVLIRMFTNFGRRSFPSAVFVI